MQPLMVEPTGSAPKRNMVKTLLLGALALVGVVCLFQSGAAAGSAVTVFTEEAKHYNTDDVATFLVDLERIRYFFVITNDKYVLGSSTT